MFRQIFGTKKDDGSEKQRQLQKEELRYLCRSPSTVRTVWSKRDSCGMDLLIGGRTRGMRTEFLVK
jgi:hypothetical protein